MIGSVQYWRRPQRVQCSPCRTLSNCSQTASIIYASPVRIPTSKLRRLLLFIPMPAPVRFAEPMYAVSKSNISILKWTRGHSIHPFLFEYYKKWLQGNVIVRRAIAEEILSESFYCYTCTVIPFIFSQYFTLAGSTTLATRSMMSCISSLSHFCIFLFSKSVESW